jgi:hypothetical protein
MEEEKATPGKEAALKALRAKFTGNSASTQRQLLAEALRQCASVTTLEARRFLDILHPAARAMELRRQGLSIITHWLTVMTEVGAKHRVALYALQRGEANLDAEP